PAYLPLCSVLFYCSGAHRALPSFPTRRSSDLHQPGHGRPRRGAGAALAEGQRGLVAGEAPQEEVRRRFEGVEEQGRPEPGHGAEDRKSTRLNSSHVKISYAVFCLKKKRKNTPF